MEVVLAVLEYVAFGHMAVLIVTADVVATRISKAIAKSIAKPLAELEEHFEEFAFLPLERLSRETFSCNGTPISVQKYFSDFHATLKEMAKG